MSARHTWTACSPRRVPSRRWRKWWERLLISRRWTAVLLTAALSLAGCGKHGDADEAEKKGEPVPDVTVAKVVRGVIADNLIVNGNLAALPNRDAKVAALVAGRIARVMVVEGDYVTGGQAVAELDATLLREQAR